MAIGTTKRPVNFSSPMSCRTLPDERSIGHRVFLGPRALRVGKAGGGLTGSNVCAILGQPRPPAQDGGRRMVASDSFAEFLREQLAPLGRVTMRRMFGKTGVFCNGLMFGMVTNDTLYFRVDDGNRAVFAEAGSEPPLNYEKQGRLIDLSFWRAPERLLDEPEELVEWAHAALAAARRVAAKRTTPRRKPKPRGDDALG